MDKLYILVFLKVVVSQTQVHYATVVSNSVSSCSDVSNFTLESYQALNFLSTANPPLAGNTDCSFNVKGPSASQFLVHFLEITLPTDSADYESSNHCDGQPNYIEIVSGDGVSITPNTWSSTHRIENTFLNSSQSQKVSIENTYKNSPLDK